MSAVEPPPGPPTGPRAWAWIAMPLVVQFAVVGVAVAAVSAIADVPDGTDFHNLPQSLVLLGAYVVFAGAVLVAARRFGPVREVLAIRRTPLLPAIGLTAAGLVAGFAVAAALEPIFHGSESQNLDPGPFPGTTSAAIAIGVSAITVVVGAGVTEELYFRGLVYGQVDQRVGVAAAVIASAGAFGLAHFQPDAFPTLFALGIILGLLRWRTNSVLPGIALHAVNNAAAFTAALVAAG